MLYVVALLVNVMEEAKIILNRSSGCVPLYGSINSQITNLSTKNNRIAFFFLESCETFGSSYIFYTYPRYQIPVVKAS
jgi:hypothetical protein